MKAYIRWFRDIALSDTALVGGKNASLGEMYRELAPRGVKVPNGFAVTADAYRDFLREAHLAEEVQTRLENLGYENLLIFAKLYDIPRAARPGQIEDNLMRTLGARARPPRGYRGPPTSRSRQPDDVREEVGSEMNKTTIAGAMTLLLLMVAALAGCARTHLTFEKPGVAAADLQRDQNQCLCRALVSEDKRILAPGVDRDSLIRCMEARGYTVSSK